MLSLSKRTAIYSFFMVFIVNALFSQGQVDILQKTNTTQLHLLSEKYTTQFQEEYQRAQMWADSTGFAMVEDSLHPIALTGFRNGFPIYLQGNNLNAAKTTSTDKIQEGGGAELDLTGEGFIIRIWDGGHVQVEHQEFQLPDDSSRVTIMDANYSPKLHSTHVGGTLAAQGLDDNARGMATEAFLYSYDWLNDASEMAGAATEGMLISNHSYGTTCGWHYIPLSEYGPHWWWYGDINVNENEDYKFGYYGVEASQWDEIANAAPYYLIVKSAGNDRNDTGPDAGAEYLYFDSNAQDWVFSNVPREPDGGENGYNCIPTFGNAKNILTVGAIYDISGGYTSPSDVVMTSFSSWGPTDDGRIKPDIVGNGTDLYSSVPNGILTGWYYELSGTSMSTPNVTGSLALLQEYYQSTHSGNSMTASALKGLVIHSSDEAGDFDGPDFRFGWGLLNAEKAASIITNDYYSIQMNRLEESSTISRSIESDGSPLKITIAWNDPASPPLPPTLNATPPTLINDLDIRLISESGLTFYPYILDSNNPDNAAAPGDNIRDNIEQINLTNPSPGLYTLEISHKGVLLNGYQDYSLIITGDVHSADGNALVKFSNKFEGNNIESSSISIYSLENELLFPNVPSDGPGVELEYAVDYIAETDQSSFPAQSIKHHDWNGDAFKFLLKNRFTAGRVINQTETANFQTSDIVNISTTTQIPVQILDPWYVRGDGTQTGQDWVNINANNQYEVFLNENLDFNPQFPVYKIRANTSDSYYATQDGIYGLRWESSYTDLNGNGEIEPNEYDAILTRDPDYPNSNTRALVVFQHSNATISFDYVPVNEIEAEEIVVEMGSSLTIPAGANIHFADECHMVIEENGTLEMLGSEDLPITLSQDVSNTSNPTILLAPTASANINHVNFDGSTSISYSGGIDDSPYNQIEFNFCAFESRVDMPLYVEPALGSETEILFKGCYFNRTFSSRNTSQPLIFEDCTFQSDVTLTSTSNITFKSIIFNGQVNISKHRDIMVSRSLFNRATLGISELLKLKDLYLPGSIYLVESDVPQYFHDLVIDLSDDLETLHNNSFLLRTDASINLWNNTFDDGYITLEDSRGIGDVACEFNINSNIFNVHQFNSQNYAVNIDYFVPDDWDLVNFRRNITYDSYDNDIDMFSSSEFLIDPNNFPNTNPMLIDPVNGNFHLHAVSPAIDHGGPELPLDPDGTVADIGAFYFPQLTGTINSNLTLGGEANVSGTFILNGNLIVDAGSRIFVGENCRIEVNGDIDIQGTSSHPVNFSPPDQEIYTWQGLYQAGDRVRINYLRLYNSYVVGLGIRGSNSGYISNSVFSENNVGARFDLVGDNVQVTDNEISHNLTIGLNLRLSQPFLKTNSIHDNGEIGVLLISGSAATLIENQIENNGLNSTYSHSGGICTIHSSPKLTNGYSEFDPWPVNNTIKNNLHGLYIANYSYPNCGVYINSSDKTYGGFNHIYGNSEASIFRSTENGNLPLSLPNDGTVLPPPVFAQVNYWYDDLNIPNHPDDIIGQNINTSFTAPSIINAFPETTTEALLELGIAMEEIENYEEAKLFYEEALNLSETEKDTQMALTSLMRVYDKLGLTAQKEETLEGFIATEDEPALVKAALLELNWFYQKAKLDQSALTTLQSLISLEDNEIERGFYILELALLSEIGPEVFLSKGVKQDSIEVKSYQAGQKLLTKYANTEPAILYALLGGVQQENPTVPLIFKLDHPYPNPFNPSTTISYQIPKTSDIKIIIYDILGRNIWNHSETAKPTGNYTLVWEGLNSRGKQVSSGIYLVSFSTPEFNQIQKVVLVR